MNHSPLVKMVSDRLIGVGYCQLATPFRVASVDFDFTSAFRGNSKRANDLVLIVDTTTGEHGDRDGRRVSQRIAGLGRALDVAHSRFVITVIMVGAVSRSSMEDLSENCRVLTVDNIPTVHSDNVAHEAARRRLDDRISVLLPLALMDEKAPLGGGEHSAIEQLRQDVTPDINQDFAKLVLDASDLGKEAVEENLINALGLALNKEVRNV